MPRPKAYPFPRRHNVGRPNPERIQRTDRGTNYRTLYCRNQGEHEDDKRNCVSCRYLGEPRRSESAPPAFRFARLLRGWLNPQTARLAIAAGASHIFGSMEFVMFNAN